MSKVAILRTKSDSILVDYSRLMRLAEYPKALSKSAATLLKLNLSWTLYFPACSTAPWQLEGILRTLRQDGYRNLLAVENQTVVTSPWKGAYNNKWLPVLEKNDVKFQPLTDVEWAKYQPKAEMMAMDEIFPEILVPRIFLGTNILHLPTMKTHGHTTTTGAIKNAFGGLIPKYRHHAHLKIHEILVDLLSIQKEIHKGIFAAMDGSLAGNGAGPRTLEPFGCNLILASEDQVAIDAISSRIMGFDPLNIEYIRLSHDRGLGVGDIDQIEIIGMDRGEVTEINFGFKCTRSPIITWDQRLRKNTREVLWLHNLLFHSPAFKSFIFASEFYHDKFWYPLVGTRIINRLKDNEWISLFNNYEHGEYSDHPEAKNWDPY